MDEEYEDLWDDAEEYERDELAQDHEEYPEEASYTDEDMPTDAHDDWRDDANEYEPIEDFGYFGEMGMNEE